MPLHRAAGDLSLDDRRVDHHAAVLADDVAQQRDGAGVRIDLDRADVARVREHERLVGRVAVQDLQARFHARRQTAGLEVRGVRDLGDGARSRGCAAHARDALDDRRCRRARPPACGRRSPSPSLGVTAPRPGSRRRGSDRCGSRRCRTRRASRWCRPGAPSRRRTARRGTRSRVARSSSRALARASRSRGRRRRCRRVGRGGARARCCTGRSCSAVRCTGRCPTPRRRPTANCSALPDAERVVVEHRRGLLERLGGRHVEHGDAERQGVRELVALQHVAAAQLERVDAELAGEAVDRLLAEVGLELPRSAVRAHASTCW